MSGGQVTLTIPEGWTLPTQTSSAEGEVLLTNYSGVSCSILSVSGRTITVTCSTLPAKKKFKLSYKKFYGPATNGQYTFVVKSKGQGGILKEIEKSPVLTVADKAKSKAKKAKKVI